MPDLATRLPCQVCGRGLVALPDGTARRHGRHGSCPGSGYRLDVWPVGRVLRHYAGSSWQVVDLDRKRWVAAPSHQWMTEYRMRCLSDPHKSFGADAAPEQTFHGEYLHRHGWTPDLMHDLERSLTAQKKEGPALV